LKSDRLNLPIYSSRQIIIDQIRENQVVIISGETGSGKSTQIPQFIMEDAIERSDNSFLQLYCCEPRRISAISLATRVSVECGDGVNQVGKLGSWIGYKVRMDNRTSSSTLITFCTLGILLRLLVGDPNLSNISHVVVDEVHERSVESDFLLLLLKRLISVRRDLKLILMSATADIQKYRTYFRNATEPVCLNIPGKVFPVTEFYLEDIEEQIGIFILLKKGWQPEILEDAYTGPNTSQKIIISGKGGKQQTFHAEWTMDEDFDARDLDKDISLKMKDLQIRNRKIDMEFLETLITYVVKYSLEHSLGSILVFLPGVAEINALQDRLNGLSNGRSALPCITFPLYSDLPNAEQLKGILKI
jgi:ATP-dependent RNA helicase DHX29